MRGLLNLYHKLFEEKLFPFKNKERIIEFAQKPIRNFYDKIKNYAYYTISKIYNLPKSYLERLKRIPIYLVDYLPSQFPNTITLGAYVSIKDRYGNILYQAILIPKYLLHKPYLFFKTLFHELVHAAQDFYGKLKEKAYRNFYEYLNDENEKEAERISNLALLNLLSKSHYARMYLL